MQYEFISSFDTPIGEVVIKATEKAVIAVGFDLRNNADRYYQANAISEDAKHQLQEYFAGTRTQFDLPLAPHGTDFQQKVWAQLMNIQFGKTANYQHIASAIGNSKASRAVGAANGKNPIAIVIPCHRIIGADGSLTGYAGGLDRKSFLLNLEKRI